MTRLTRSIRLTAALSTCIVAIAGALAAPASAGGPSAGALLVVAMSADQQRACEAERQALQQQLNQCGADQQCRQRLQAAIASLNARCRG